MISGDTSQGQAALIAPAIHTTVQDVVDQLCDTVLAQGGDRALNAKEANPGDETRSSLIATVAAHHSAPDTYYNTDRDNRDCSITPQGLRSTTDETLGDSHIRQTDPTTSHTPAASAPVDGERKETLARESDASSQAQQTGADATSAGAASGAAGGDAATTAALRGNENKNESDDAGPRSHAPPKKRLVDRYGFLVPERPAVGGNNPASGGWDSDDEDGECGPPPPLTHQRALAQPDSKAERRRRVRLENLKIAKWHAMLEQWPKWKRHKEV
jgi:hypothetical protein